MSPARLSASFFHALPKTDLHCHLDGSLRFDTLRELAKEENIALPTSDPNQLKKLIGMGEQRADLEGYLRAFDITCSVMQTKWAIERVTYELVEDAANENVWHLEIRFCPLLMTHGGLSLKQVVKAVAEGVSKATKKYDIRCVLILCALRSFSKKDNMQIAKLANECGKEDVVALDLAGPESGYPAKDYHEIFAQARKSLLHVTIHAGEAYGPNSIRQALYVCGAERIGHGTTLFEHQELLRYVINRRISIEACLTSNVQTGIVKDISSHPFRQYLREGARVTLNTDNRLMSDVTVTYELMKAYEELHLSFEEIKTVLINGFKSAFLPHEEKGQLLKRVNERFAEIEDQKSCL